MTFERTRDADMIRLVMTDPHVYPHISDDGCPPAERFEPMVCESIWYVAVRDGDELLGVWIFVPQNAVCWEIHTCLLPNAWGKRAAEAAQALASWVWENTPCRRVITSVPAYNRVAYRFAKRAGLTDYGRNAKSFLKDGKLADQLLLGLSKPEEPCQQQS